MEITNSLDKEESESQHSSQPLDQVNYGTQPDEMVRSFEDYDWDQGRRNINLQWTKGADLFSQYTRKINFKLLKTKKKY